MKKEKRNQIYRGIYYSILYVLAIVGFIGFVSLLAGCEKQSKTFHNLKGTIRIKAEKITDLHLNGNDSIFVSIGENRFSFATFNNPCLNKSFGYNRQSFDKEKIVNFTVETEREIVKAGGLKLTEIGNELIIE